MRFKGVWDNALPATDFELLEVLPSESVFEAAVAAILPVCLFGVFVWDNALPAAFLDFVPVLLVRIVFEAFVAAFFPVVLRFCAIVVLP